MEYLIKKLDKLPPYEKYHFGISLIVDAIRLAQPDKINELYFDAIPAIKEHLQQLGFQIQVEFQTYKFSTNPTDTNTA